MSAAASTEITGLTRLMRPRAVAIVGATAEPGSAEAPTIATERGRISRSSPSVGPDMTVQDSRR